MHYLERLKNISINQHAKRYIFKAWLSDYLEAIMLNVTFKKLFNKKTYLTKLHTMLVRFTALVFTAMLAHGCSVTPTSIVNQPTSARTPSLNHPQSNNGGIYSAGTYRPMFEDHRPRFIGDIVTINIIENTSATKANGSSGDKTGSANFNTDAKLSDNVPLVGGLISKLPFAKLGSASASSNNAYTDDAAANAKNVFSGSITTTVIDVLPNGYLAVSGEKQVALDKGTEFIRFSGVVNPDTISLGNSVASTRVADARIEYRTNSKIDGAAIASMFARFFLSVSPW